jgi:hypothetical protein
MVVPRTIILVDDAWVTGAMATEAAKVLCSHGAKYIHTLVYARIRTRDANIERSLERSAPNCYGVDFVIELLNSREYCFTGFMITILATLIDSEFEYVWSRIAAENKLKIIRLWANLRPIGPLLSSPLARYCNNANI